MNNLPPRNPNFTGRKSMLGLLAEILERGNLVVVNQTGPLKGGVGKSELALEAAHSWVAAGGAAWWVRAQTDVSREVDLGRLADAAGVEPGPDTARVLDEAGGRLGELLVVFDGERDLARLQASLRAGARFKAVATTLSRDWEGQTVALDRFTFEEAALYLTRATGLKDPDWAANLGRTLERLPLALSLAAACIRRHGMTFLQYWSGFCVHQNWGDTDGDGVMDDPVRAALAMTLDSLEDPALGRLVAAVCALEPLDRSEAALDDPAATGDWRQDHPAPLADLLGTLAEYRLLRRRMGLVEVHPRIVAGVRELGPRPSAAP